MKICAATGNAGKLRELRRILEAQGHEVVSQKELGITIEPEEPAPPLPRMPHQGRDHLQGQRPAYHRR